MKNRSKSMLYFILAVALMTAVLFRLRWDRSRRAAEHHRLGLLAIRQGNWNRAIEEFQREAVLTPHQSSPYYSIGIVAKRRGNYPLAAQSLRKAIELGTMETDAHCALGEISYRMTEYRAAVEPLQECIAREPDNDQARYWLTQSYLGQGLTEDAERTMKALIERRPQEAQFHYVLGTIYLARSASPENNKAALDSLQHAVALDDSLVGAYYSLGMIYRRLNRLSEAAESLERALKLDPNGKEIRRLLATTYQQMGKADAAQKQFRKVREQMTQERHAQRLNYLLGEAEMRSPQNPAAHFQLGCFYLETNELNKAAAALQNAARLDPRWAEVHDKLALVYQRLGKQEEANKERKTARELRQP